MFNKNFLMIMQKLVNFKKSEVCGVSKAEAFEKAPFHIMSDATQAYKLWLAKQTGVITDALVKEFCVEQLQKKTKMTPGVGLAITLESAVADTRERPYKFDDVKNEKGKRKYKTTYQIKTMDGKILANCEETKAKAKEIVRSLYTDINNPLREDVICTYSKQVVEGEPVAFTAKYTPSKGSKSGRWLVFGVEE